MEKKKINHYFVIFKQYLIILSLFLFLGNLQGQNQHQIDSLNRVLKTTENDTVFVSIYAKLGDAYENTLPDTSIYLYNLALSYANKSGSIKHIAMCHRHIGMIYSAQCIYDLALENYKIALKMIEKLKDKEGMANCFDNMGVVYFYQGDYDKSTAVFLQSLKIREELGDKRGISKSYNNIGNVKYSMNDFNEALEYYTKSMIIIEELGDKNGISSCYNNIGLVYMDQGSSMSNKKQARDKYLKAVEFFNKSLNIDQDLKDKKGMSACFSNLGFAYFKLGEYDKTISFYLQSLKIDEELGDREGQSLVLGNMADLKIKQKDYISAIVYAEQSLSIGKEIGALPIQQTSYEKLSKVYDSLKNYKKAYENYKYFKLLNDSMFNLESNKQIKQMEMRYQSEKKQLEIDNLTKDKELKDKTIALDKRDMQKQRIVIYSFIFVFLVIGVFSFLLHRQYHAKNRAFKKLEQQNIEIQKMNEEISAQRDYLQLYNSELQQKNEEILAQRDEIENHLDKIQKQKAVIEQKNNSITASISYAQRIQQSILPEEKYLRKLLPESFILFKPKDIVSGDFYWIGEKAEKIFIATVDCTGHGVPGAFMSLLGYVFLNQALHGTSAESPAEILNFLSNEIFITLRKSDTESYIKDGMDLSICAIHKEALILEYAGVHNDSYLIRNKEIMELKSDNHQIGEPFSASFSSFTNKTYQLEKGDQIYLFSDGYIDQFGGNENKKFMSKQFKETLLKITANSMKEQCLILDQTIEAWENKYEVKQKQTDDITVVGIKI